MNLRSLYLALALWLGCLLPAGAHESLPASLLLTEVAPQRFDVDWRIPATQGSAPVVAPRFPAGCAASAPPQSVDTPAAQRLRWQVQCKALDAIAFDGFGASMINVLTRIAYLDGRVVSEMSSASHPNVLLAGPAHIGVNGYFGLGVAHILSGYDHLLFILSLILLIPARWRLLQTITAFTLAHSITLALAALGLVHVPGAPVEATIALSIVFLARELARPSAPQGMTARRPWAVAFCFGLLHGLGFAGALSEVGLPEGAIPQALLLFNLGVEAGQLAFVGAVLALLVVANNARVGWPRWSRQLASYGIGSISACWLLQRLAALGWSGIT
ncbi:MAG: HupE/UreJ family protein [Pseudomonadota bacterium]